MKKSSQKEELFTLWFWLLHLILLCVAYLGFLPTMGPVFFADTFAGELPFDLFLPLIGLIGVPTTSALLGIEKTANTSTSSLAAQPPTTKRKIRLKHLFYGVEAPLVLICLIRFFGLRQLTPASSLILITGCICAGAYLHQLLKRNSTAKNAWLQLALHSLMLAIAVYVGTLALFYAIPTTWAFLGTLLSVLVALPIFLFSLSFLTAALIFVPVLAIFLLLLFGIATVPFGMAILYIKAWRKNLQRFASRHGWTKAWAGTIAVLIVWLTLT